MPITHTIDAVAPRVCTTAEGMVTYEELCRHLDEEAREHALGMGELLDGSGATTNLTAGQARMLAHRTERLVRAQPFGPLAIIATTDVAYGMARMYQTLCQHLPVRIGVFRDAAEGRAWLGASIQALAHRLR